MVSTLKLKALLDSVRHDFRAIEEESALSDQDKQLLKRYWLWNLFVVEAQKLVEARAARCTRTTVGNRMALRCNGFVVGFGTLLQCFKHVGHEGPCQFSKSTESVI